MLQSINKSDQKAANEQFSEEEQSFSATLIATISRADAAILSRKKYAAKRKFFRAALEIRGRTARIRVGLRLQPSVETLFRNGKSPVRFALFESSSSPQLDTDARALSGQSRPSAQRVAGLSRIQVLLRVALPRGAGTAVTFLGVCLTIGHAVLWHIPIAAPASGAKAPTAITNSAVCLIIERLRASGIGRSQLRVQSEVPMVSCALSDQSSP